MDVLPLFHFRRRGVCLLSLYARCGCSGASACDAVVFLVARVLILEERQPPHMHHFERWTLVYPGIC